MVVYFSHMLPSQAGPVMAQPGPADKECTCFASVLQPTVILWGASDPWEPVGRAKEVFSGWSADFVELPGMAATTAAYRTGWLQYNNEPGCLGPCYGSNGNLASHEAVGADAK